jgi:phosphoadenosine phosphosulfate reductase
MMMTTHQNTQIYCDRLNFSALSPFSAHSDFSELCRHFEERPLADLLQWSLSTFGDRVAQITSFGPTGMVILDHLARLSPGIHIITLDTQFLFEETYRLWEAVQRRYPIRLEIRRPALTPEAQAQQYGPQLWQTAPNQCCHLRKVISLREVLAGLDAWFTGLRRDQSPTRAHLDLVTWDNKYGLVKINPLANWTRGQVWSYILEHKVPYNVLHDRGYASIGCTHCTHPTTNPGDERSGRWQGLAKTECGIHV